MKRELKIELTELFMAQADKYRCFHGIIKKSKDENGNTLFYSKIKINGGYICAQDSDRDKLGKKLDEMCIMVLDKGLHADEGSPRWFCSQTAINMSQIFFFEDRKKSDKIVDDLCKFYMN